MRDVQVNIASTSFPTQFVSDSEKASSEFGIQVGQAIQYEWFKRDGNSCRFYSENLIDYVCTLAVSNR